MIAEVTEADRNKAADVVRAVGDDYEDFYEWQRHIAAALAEEREKARAPFLALAKKLDDRAYNLTTPVQRVIADAIRRAAEEQS